MKNLMKKILLKIIQFYRKAISPYTSKSCRYRPTCSQYAMQAIEKYGAIKGGFLSIKRILHCQPFSKHGYFYPLD